MSYNSGKQNTSEVWAVTDLNGNVMFSRGGSSTSPKLMVYVSEAKAWAAVNNSWIKQIIPDPKQIKVVLIHTADK